MVKISFMKKNSLIRYILIIVLFFLLGCQRNNQNSNEDVISVNLQEERVDVSLYEIFSAVELIPLETKDTSLIRNISKVKVYDDMYLVLDLKAQKVIVFDSNGKYLFQINNRGEGPAQYINLADYDIYNDSIYLLSGIDSKVHIYNLKGKFVKKISLPQINRAYNLIKIINQDIIALWTSDDNNRLRIYSRLTDNIIKESFPEEYNFFNQSLFGVFFYRTNIARPINNQVFAISSNGNLIQQYKWDFGQLKNNKIEAPTSFNTLEEMNAYLDKIYSSEIINYIFSGFGENSHYVYSQVVRKNKVINVFHNKETRNNLIFEKTSEGANLNLVFWSDRYAIGICPEIHLTIDDILPNEILDKRNIKIKEEINEFDNPILIRYNFK